METEGSSMELYNEDLNSVMGSSNSLQKQNYEENGIQKVSVFCYEGELVNGLKCGIGNIYFVNGDKYEGQFKNDVFHGNGRYTCGDRIYIGTFINGLLNGSVQIHFKNRDRCSTIFRNGKISNQCIYIYANGDSYKGSFLLNDMFLRNGHGLYKCWNGDIYEGDFYNNFVHGQGIYTNKNGLCYKGEFKYGMCSGNGCLYDPIKNINYEGKWIDNLLISDTIVIKANGEILNIDSINISDKNEMNLLEFTKCYHIVFMNPYKDTIYMCTRQNSLISSFGKREDRYGNIYEGQFVNNYQTGYGRMRYISNDIYEGYWRDSLREGYGIYTNSKNQIIYEGIWKNDQPIQTDLLINPSVIQYINKTMMSSSLEKYSNSLNYETNLKRNYDVEKSSVNSQDEMITDNDHDLCVNPSFKKRKLMHS